MRHVLTLALDTSSSSGSLAVLREDQPIGCVSTATGEIYSSRMFRHLEFLLRELSLELRDFGLFAVASGPGSFTGLRVGLTAAKGWSEVSNTPIAAVSALEAVAAQSHSTAPHLVPVLNAHRGQVYFSVYSQRAVAAGADSAGRLRQLGDECVMTPDEFFASLSARAISDFTIVTPEPALIASRNETMNVASKRPSVEKVSALLAPIIGRLGYRRVQRGEVVDSLALDANYIRRTDAELHWKPWNQA